MLVRVNPTGRSHQGDAPWAGLTSEAYWPVVITQASGARLHSSTPARELVRMPAGCIETMLTTARPKPLNTVGNSEEELTLKIAMKRRERNSLNKVLRMRQAGQFFPPRLAAPTGTPTRGPWQ